MDTFDLTVVGGSFAGLSCARRAAAHGLKTVVLERKADPGQQVRTTGILVKEAADLLHLPPHLGKTIPGVRLYSPNGQSIDLVSPGYSFVATDTPALMRWLTCQAELAGTEVRLSQNARVFRRQKEAISLPDLSLQTRYLVGSDGARSNVARHFGLSRNTHFLLGAEIEFEGIRDLAPDRLHVFLDSRHAPGYIGWIVPGVGISQVGIAVRQSHQPKLDSFVEILKKRFDFSQARIVGRRGGLIPCGGLLKHWHDQRIMLLGDAAGMVSPLTAGGIHPALEIGSHAGSQITRYLRGEIANPATALAPLVPGYRFKGIMRWTIDQWSPPDLLYNLALSNPLFRRVAQILFFHHRGLFCADAWKEIFLLPHAPAKA